MAISWDDFKVNNLDSEGLRQKFENLCRLLFVVENVHKNKQFRYLHANPNNPGIETDPIYDETGKKYIGFQAKYFENNVSYKDIEDSAEKTVKYYKGKVDLVFLFCNKPLTSTSLKKTEDILKDANIDLQLITDKAILDLIEFKYPYLGNHFFARHTLDATWFQKHSNHMFDILGERYNRVFNVETSSLTELSLFVHDRHAVAFINQKKTELLHEIERIYWRRIEDRSYLIALEQATKNLSDVDEETLDEAIQWKETIEEKTSEYLERYRKELTELQEKRQKYHERAGSSGISKEESDLILNNLQNLHNQIIRTNELLELPSYVKIEEREQELLAGNVLAVIGRAGIGKSQLLAYETEQLLEEDRAALLLLAGTYYTNDPICEQIAKKLKLDYSFDDLVDVLETIGEINNRIVPIFIDAVNETWNKDLWKEGLPEIIEKVNNCRMVKIIFSYRPEYEKLLLSESIKKMKEDGDILKLYHKGFEDNSVQAISDFFNHYGIPFTPLEYFGYEMSNPLFLTLYCKTYNGEEVSLPELYERLVEGANEGIFKVLRVPLSNQGFLSDANIIRPMIGEMASIMIEQDSRSITHSDLCKLSFWSQYNLAPAAFINCLKNEHILQETVSDGEEIHYYFAYDQMNDYYCAKAIVQKYQSKEQLRQYLADIVLCIEDEEIRNIWNTDIFVNACALYAGKFEEECIDIIDNIKDDSDKQYVLSRYIDSFQWRDKKSISAVKLCDLLKKYPCDPEDLWKMLIGNSVKISHPLNAEFLHTILLSYPLNERDRLWTTHINTLTSNDENRIVQLVQMYNEGKTLEITDEKQIKLILTLFSWLLTSSNRWLRDNASKAMVEILKNHFDLCVSLLEKFRDVNDPYVIQRLYGIVFGACCKRNSNDYNTFQGLAQYVYDIVFDQDKVYPDILLRDYARLIIERFLYENSDYDGYIERNNIEPPYNSDPIPKIEDQHYLDNQYDGGMFWLIYSMRFEGMGMYGDFGRYVFQSALHAFDINDKEIFNYALFYILEELGYNDEYFGEHDTLCGSYDRHVTAKTERIGKKYQWITMYNILARISDHCKMVDQWSYPEKTEVHFEGAWEPFVRDFDPTLNKHFMNCLDAPTFSFIDKFIKTAKRENENADLSDKEKSTVWLDEKGVFFEELKDTLLLKDDNGDEWVSLTEYIDTGRKNLADDKLLVWSWVYAFFVNPGQKEAFRKVLARGGSIINIETTSHHQTYSIFNREYPWAPSCKTFNEDAWANISFPTDEKKTVAETEKKIDIDACQKLIEKLGYISSLEELEGSTLSEEFDQNDAFEIQHKDEIIEDEIYETEEIGMILHATSDLIWEAEYDASKDETISWSAPCAEIIEALGLAQRKNDGFYYDCNNKLGAFDISLIQKNGGVVIRKDLLEEFLFKSNMELIWIVKGGKEIHGFDLSITRWSDWEAMYEYNSGEITGDIRRI